MENVTIDKDFFPELKKMIVIQKKCKYCNVRIQKNNFAILHKSLSVCKNMCCLTQWVIEHPEMSDNFVKKEEGDGK